MGILRTIKESTASLVARLSGSLFPRTGGQITGAVQITNNGFAGSLQEWQSVAPESYKLVLRSDSSGGGFSDYHFDVVNDGTTHSNVLVLDRDRVKVQLLDLDQSGQLVFRDENGNVAGSLQRGNESTPFGIALVCAADYRATWKLGEFSFTGPNAGSTAILKGVYDVQDENGDSILIAGRISGLGTAATVNTGTTSGTIPLLGAGGKLDTSLIPASAITDTYVVASQAAMLSLSAAETGDVAVRTDLNKTFILKGTTYSTLADWQELLTPTDTVTSVNGRTGVVTTAIADITDSSAVGRSVLTAANAAAARTAIGAGSASTLSSTTVGGNLVTLTNPGAVTFLQVNADNSVTALSASAFRTAIGAGTSSTTGTVTSVGLTMPSIFSVAGSAVTSSGTLAVTLATQTANTVWSGPSSGSAATPTFRALGGADLTALFFGTGSAGSLTVTNGQTVVLTSTTYYSNVTVNAGGILQFGTDATVGTPRLYCSGTLTVNGTIRGGGSDFSPINARTFNGARKTTVGAGNGGNTNNGAQTNTLHLTWGGCSGSGGGDGTNIGGGASLPFGMLNNGNMPFVVNTGAQTFPTGTTTAGSTYTLGNSGALLASGYSYDSVPMLPGMPGRPGGSGALKVAGGTNYGGAGGAGGYGALPVDISAAIVVVGSGGIIQADGYAGADGETANASNANGDIAGGGGGGGGGGASVVRIRTRSLINSGTIRASGGAGGTGGGGREMTGGVANTARATSNGGNGASGSAGIVVTEVLP